MFFRNIGIYLQVHVALQPDRRTSILNSRCINLQLAVASSCRGTVSNSINICTSQRVQILHVNIQRNGCKINVLHANTPTKAENS
jgi:hypothetical protein